MYVKPLWKPSMDEYMMVTRPRPVPMYVAALSAAPEPRPPTMKPATLWT